MTEGSNTWSNAYTGMNLATTLGGSGTLVYFGFGGGRAAPPRSSRSPISASRSLAGNINILPSASVLQIASGAVADINGNAQTISSLSGPAR